jgi:ATP-dependent RNA helicase RhlE
VTPRNSAAPLVTQVVHPVDRERKRELLSHLIRTGVIDQALIFTRTKHGANRLAEQLERDGIAAIAIHGNKSQGQRVRALADFKSGRTPILVATEIAARGLDIDALPHVVNYELPMVAEDYVHRIGRTGRAGSPGHAVSLVCIDEHRLLRDIESVLGRPVPQVIVPGFEPDKAVRPEPILRGGLGRPRPGSHHVGRPTAASRHAPAWAPNGGRNDRPRPGQARPNGPRQGQGRPSAPGERPVEARPSGPRPVQARPHGPRPAQGRPLHSSQGPLMPIPRSGRSSALPGERFARDRRPD